ncbi:MAG: hypothetical protein AB1461_21230, partial [Thermodesulfobacteriota bacterium]
GGQGFYRNWLLGLIGNDFFGAYLAFVFVCLGDGAGILEPTECESAWNNDPLEGVIGFEN